MKKSVKLIIVLVLTGLLVAAVVIIPGLFNEETETPADVETTTTDLPLFNESDVDCFEYEYQNEKITVKRLDTGKWTLYGNEEFPLIQSYPSDMIDALRVLKVKRVLEGESVQMSDYGLEEPVYYYTVTLKDGRTLDYRVGNYNSLLDAIYLRFAGENKVYLVEDVITDTFLSTAFDMIMRESVPEISRTNATKLELNTSEHSEVISIEKESFDEESDETDENGNRETVTYTRFTYSAATDGEDSVPAIAANAESLLDGVVGLKLGSCVAFKPDEEELTQYGLDGGHALGIKIYYTEKVENNNEDAVVEVTADKDFSFTLGMTGEGYFASVSGDRVYKLSDDVGNAIYEPLEKGLTPADEQAAKTE